MSKATKGAAKELFGLSLDGFVPSLVGGRRGRASGPVGKAFVLLGDEGRSYIKKLPLAAWQKARFEANRKTELAAFSRDDGPVWVLLPVTTGVSGHEGLLTLNPYAQARHLGAALAAALGESDIQAVEVHFVGADEDAHLGFVVGLELGFYRYKKVTAKRELPLPHLTLIDVAAHTVDSGVTLGVSVNLARHLVNAPGNVLNPTTFAEAVGKVFRGIPDTELEIWQGPALRREGLRLLEAVGAAAEHGPALMMVRYRPRKTRGDKPLAFVGKGITFDSGGLDIKDAASMRLMKKDMGGAASLVGLAYWVTRVRPDVPCDFYLALAENAVGERAMRPGDVFTARSGLSVEIDNTDAEGRLVLADAIDVALTRKGGHAPAALIDLATLTGAMRVALGTRIAGLFANDDRLAAELLDAGRKRGEATWRMPLFNEYASGLRSTFADMANSGTSRFGGAITAALFLERFIKGVPWAHLDMYAWVEAGTPGYNEAGGSGQCVQLLAKMLDERSR